MKGKFMEKSMSGNLNRAFEYDKTCEDCKWTYICFDCSPRPVERTYLQKLCNWS